MIWKCIGGLQYISSHPLVARVIECLVKGFCLLYLLPCGAVLSGLRHTGLVQDHYDHLIVIQFSNV
jgi:hypothetical protein